jgi:hypothetical protein
VELILLESHYKFAILSTLGDLMAVVDGDPNTTKLLMDSMLSTVAILSITYNIERECVVWKGPNWECLLSGLFNYKVYFQSVFYICNREAFSHLFAIVTKYKFSSKLRLEFGQYMVIEIEVPLGKETFMKIRLCYFTPTFFSIE